MQTVLAFNYASYLEEQAGRILFVIDCASSVFALRQTESA